jgi:hypothetical protein
MTGTQVFVQYFGESSAGGEFDFVHTDPETGQLLIGCGNGISNNVAAPGGPGRDSTLANVPFELAPCDGWNNTYTCTRKVETSMSKESYMYCEFDCFEDLSHRKIPCDPNRPEGYGEYYDMATDPWQMHNAAPGLNPRSKAELAAVINSLRHCAGQGSIEHGGCRLGTQAISNPNLE